MQLNDVIKNTVIDTIQRFELVLFNGQQVNKKNLVLCEKFMNKQIKYIITENFDCVNIEYDILANKMTVDYFDTKLALLAKLHSLFYKFEFDNAYIHFMGFTSYNDLNDFAIEFMYEDIEYYQVYTLAYFIVDNNIFISIW